MATSIIPYETINETELTNSSVYSDLVQYVYGKKVYSLGRVNIIYLVFQAKYTSGYSGWQTIFKTSVLPNDNIQFNTINEVNRVQQFRITTNGDVQINASYLGSSDNAKLIVFTAVYFS